MSTTTMARLKSCRRPACRCERKTWQSAFRYNSIGVLHFLDHKFDEALATHYRALAIVTAVADTGATAGILAAVERCPDSGRRRSWCARALEQGARFGDSDLPGIDEIRRLAMSLEPDATS
jgi:hypothetical protein